MSKDGKPQSNFTVGGNKFTVNPKYKLLRAIGHGAYGFVCSAENTQIHEFVAIKKITNLFNNPIETKRAIREVQLLRKLRHENILGLMDLMMNDHRTDLYLVSELMDSDLHQIIVSKQHLSNDHVQYFVYQILRGLLFIHSANVIHRDLKPSNILVNSNCDIKICDFGLARPVDATVEDHKAFMTEYVATRWYRAPEIMLSWKQYSFAIDIWATGCILAELLGRMPLFPGKDYMDQLKRTLNYIGKPSGDEISHIRTERARQWVRNFPPTPRVDWRHLYPKADAKSISLLDDMLQFSPSKRIAVENALKHPYLEQLHDASDEPVANFKFDMSFEAEFKDNTVEISKTKAVLERELNWFSEFQFQRTKFMLQQKAGNGNGGTPRSNHSHSPSGNQSPAHSNGSNSVHNTPQKARSQTVIMNANRTPNRQNGEYGVHSGGDVPSNPNAMSLTQQSEQRRALYQQHLIQQQMLIQHNQQMLDQRNRSQSYPLLPSQQHHAQQQRPPQQMQSQHSLTRSQSLQRPGFMNQQQPFGNPQYAPFMQPPTVPQPFQQQPLVPNLGRQPMMMGQGDAMMYQNPLANTMPIIGSQVGMNPNGQPQSMNARDRAQSMNLD